MTFTLDGKEADDARRWIDEHATSCPIQNTGAAGGAYWFCFAPTGIGVAVRVRCICGAEKT